MPKPPRFPTARGQQIAVGVVTFLVFGLAIGLAQVYTQSKEVSYEVELAPSQVDELSLLLPVQWERKDSRPTDSFFVGTFTLLFDTAAPPRHLTVSHLESVDPAPSEVVIRRVLGIPNPNRLPLVSFRGRSSIGVFAIRARLAEINHRTIHVTDWTIVLTEDQRRHWVIMLTAPTSPDPGIQRSNEELVLTIAESADDTKIPNVNTPAAPADPAAPD